MADLRPLDRAVAIDIGKELDFDLGGLRVKPAERAVEMNGGRRELQPRVMQVLVALAKARPSVVSRDKLIELCWGGRIVGDDAINRCVLALRHLADEFSPQPFTVETVPRVGHRLVECGATGEPVPIHGKGKLWALLSALAVLLVLMAAAILSQSHLWPRRGSDRAPTVLVSAVAGERASQDLARDLAVKLGSLQTVQPAPMRLVTLTGASVKPDLLLQVLPLEDPSSVGASVVLTQVPSQAVLWSKEFKQSSRSIADLEEQIAFTAARILGCTAEGLTSEEPLSEANLKVYLNACATVSDDIEDPRSTVRSLEGLVQESPGFLPAWALLVSTELSAVLSPTLDGQAMVPSLKRHIATARQLDPNLPEAYLAQFHLLPQNQFVQRGRLLDTAVAQNPNNAELRAERSAFLRSMGRIHDALQDAREAVELDPLSPSIREAHIMALAIAGRMDEAWQELRTAERLWPGSTTVEGTRFTLNLRWGDPREALRYVESRDGPRKTPKIHEPFLRARIDPTPKNVEQAVRHGRMVFRETPTSIVMYSQLLAEFDRKEELLDILLKWQRMDIVGEIVVVLFRPAFADVHRDPRFMGAAHHLGLVRYWRSTGEWPDFCYAAGLPYDCKAEAAKIAA